MQTVCGVHQADDLAVTLHALLARVEDSSVAVAQLARIEQPLMKVSQIFIAVAFDGVFRPWCCTCNELWTCITVVSLSVKPSLLQDFLNLNTYLEHCLAAC